MDLREVGYDDRDWINLAQDRDRWRAYVRAVNEPSGSLKAICKHNITALDHPPYSPDLSPPDYFLFPRLKSHLKGRRFNAEEVIANATRALRRVSQNGFQACFQELYTRWQKCVVAEGNYFEGNAVE
ncbi:hypothetical protein ANN_16367 [Periplaneta americana]|uniref:Histone-lysine N-methyltransferase SETMAR n=1 Tax=Periplaneta americana TaxID=6978 RepID=A0ABQ8SJ81_PERAM|nr:hypothetical protein ANN_16367 [Periplaneta americana]